MPTDAGAKRTVQKYELPGAIVRGVVRPDKLKPAPVSTARERVRLPLPGFEILSVCVFVTPVGTLPKPTEEGTTEICG